MTLKILSIAKYDLIKLFRDKSLLVIVIALPVVFTFVMGLAYGSAGSAQVSKVSVGLVKKDSSEIANQLIASIKNDKTIQIIEMEEAELYDKVKNSGLESGFIIPVDFGQKVREGKIPTIEVLKLPTSTGYMVVEGIINMEYTRMQLKESYRNYIQDKIKDLDISKKEIIMSSADSKIEESLKEPSVVSVSEGALSEEGSVGFNGKARSSIGMAIMFVMFVVILGAGEILEEKKNKTWGRLLSTPTNKSTIMLGKIMGNFLRGWAQVGFLILFGQFVMGVNWGNSLFSSFILISVYLLCLNGLGMMLASLVRTNSQLGAYSSIFIISTSMLSGCYWPIEIVPEFMQKIAMVFPQYWAMKGLDNIVIANLGIGSVMNSLIVLIGMTILFFTLSTAAMMNKNV